MKTFAHILFRLAGVPLAAGIAAGAHELKDISLSAARGQAWLDLEFAAAPGEARFPLYFRKADAAKGVVTLSFLGAETVFPYGPHPLDPKAPALEDVTLKKITSPSGKEFLGIELKLRDAASPLLEDGAPALDVGPQGTLRLALGGSGGGKYAWTLSKAGQGADAYLTAAAAPPPANAPEKEEERDAAAAYSAPAPAPSAAATGKSGSGNSASPASGKDAGKPAAGAEPTDPPDPIASAHADGQALEKRSATGSKSLSSSRIFTLAAGGKTLVMLKDSASLRREPGPKGEVVRKLPIGDSVAKLEVSGGNVRVAAGGDTGWIRAAEAVYADELTAAQEKAIAKRLADNQARREAEQARLAAAQAREEEKRRKAEEAAAEAARKLAEKQAAEEAKRQAQAAAAPPEGIREAGALPGAQGNAASGQAANGNAAPGAAPRLSLADNPELAGRLAQEKQAAEDEKRRIEPEENRVSYNSYGRRDPFIPVEQGVSDNGIDIDQMKVVGIIWQASQPMAVLEHNKESGISFTVKEGDPVHNGRVARISHDAVTFDISEYGISRSYSLRLVSSNAKEGAKR